MKELTRDFNQEGGQDKPEQYVGTVLRNSGLGDYISRQGAGTRIEVPKAVLLDHFNAHNIPLDLLEAPQSEAGEASEAPQTAHEAREAVPAQEPPATGKDNIFTIFEEE